MSGVENGQAICGARAQGRRADQTERGRPAENRIGGPVPPLAYSVGRGRDSGGTRYSARELELTAQGVSVYASLKTVARWIRRPERSIRAWAGSGDVRTKKVPTWDGLHVQYNRIDCERAAKALG